MKWSYFYIELLFLSILTVSCYDEKDLEPSNIVSSYSVPQGTHDYDDVIVDIYDQYIQGDVYWYRLEKFLGGTVAGEEVSPQEALYADIFWEEIDSCGGFYGGDVTENGMTECWPEMEEVA